MSGWLARCGVVGGALCAALAAAAQPRQSGVEFMSSATQALQRDDAQNPAFLWVKGGAQRFEAACVGRIEAGADGAVEVEDAEQLVPAQDRYDDLGVRRRVAGDVPGERVHILHDDCRAARRRRAADTAPERDANACGLALKRPEQEIAVCGLYHVHTDPVELRQAPVEQGSEVCCVRDEITLALEQRAQARPELGVCG